jgi:DNA-binding NtrC family response regulator
MVYGTVEQTGGHIVLDSQPGCGTTFKIYLPRRGKADQQDEVSNEFSHALRGTETILLAEDEPLVRDLARAVLERYGYAILDAADCRAALAVAERYSGIIDLLLTDLVMPDMNGYQLAQQLGASRPEMNVLYMSGYSEDAIGTHASESENGNFVRKPFTPDFLARKVRQALDSKAVSAKAGGRRSPKLTTI